MEKGYLTAKALEGEAEDYKKENSEMCVCGHPKYMHAETNFGKRFLFCKVHGCRPSLISGGNKGKCTRFMGVKNNG